MAFHLIYAAKLSKQPGPPHCDNCGKIYEAIYFPYKSINYCINCYENEHRVVLHKHRQKINRSVIKKITKRYARSRQVCPICQAESLVIDENGSKICKNCGRNWTSNGVVKNSIYKKLKTKDNFKRENTLEEIVAYLKNQEVNNKPLKFWYRDDTKPREIYDYFIDEKYVQARADKGYFIKFLIDRIRKI